MKINLKFHITQELQHLLDVLEKHEASPRFVGGIVRDSIIGFTSADIDIATRLHPTEIMAILSANKIRYVDTGSKYGTITALVGYDKAEITTLRIDTECNGRHTNPIFTDDFEIDALRRDFTINAMSYCPFLNALYDYTGGYEDLLARKVRFIGAPKKRIEEDHLRILRFFRFSDRFAEILDKESLYACIDLRHLLHKISKERILMEMNKIIASPTAHKILKYMIDSQIMAEIMPEAIYDLDLLEELKDSVTLKYAALLWKTKIEILRKLLLGLRFSKSDNNEIINLVLFKQNNPDLSKVNMVELKNIFYPLWVANIKLAPYISISGVNKNKSFNELMQLIDNTPPKFSLNGEDLISMGVEGKNIGVTLDRLKSQWIKSEFTLSNKELLDSVIQ